MFMLIDDNFYHLQSCVEVWDFLCLYGCSSSCDESKWHISIFNHADLIRAEWDECIRAPKWLLRFELWQGQSRWLLCSHTGGILYSQSKGCRRLNPLSNCPSSKIVVVLFVFLLYFIGDALNKKTLIPTQILALFLMLIQHSLAATDGPHHSPPPPLFLIWSWHLFLMSFSCDCSKF